MLTKRNKITIVGAGYTGTTTALLLAQNQLGDIVLIDVPQLESRTRGKALDMQHAGAVYGSDSHIMGSASYMDAVGSDIVIITAGQARQHGMSRDDLLAVNTEIVTTVCKEVKTHCPDAIVIVLSNPVDAMTYVAYETLGFPKHRVIGQAGILDTARFCTFLAQELDVSVEDVHGIIIGGHGDYMVPLVRTFHVGGIPIESLLSTEQIERIVQRTRTGGGEIVSLLGSGSAYYAPAASLVHMVDAMLKDKRRVIPAICLLEGEYGYTNTFMGVPTIIGARGIEKIIQLDLNAAEKEALATSAEYVQHVINMVGVISHRNGI